MQAAALDHREDGVAVAETAEADELRAARSAHAFQAVDHAAGSQDLLDR